MTETLSVPFVNHDTLTVYYKPLPGWLKKQYGITPGNTAPSVINIRQNTHLPKASDRHQSPVNINISGAKKFSIVYFRLSISGIPKPCLSSNPEACKV